MKNNNKNKFSHSFFAVILLLLFLSILQIFFPKSLGFFESGFNYIKKPFFNLFTNNQTEDRTVEDLIAENSQLRQAIREEGAEFVELKNLQEENYELRKILELNNNQTENLVAAEIIGQQKINNQTFIIINKGIEDGLFAGMPVIVENKFLLGIISYASSKTSFVLPPNESSNSLSVRLLNSEQTVQGVIEGSSSLTINFELIPKDAPIQNGDIVVTSGLDPFIPPGLIVGLVESVKDSPNEFFKQAVVKPIALPEEYRFVNAITTKEFELPNDINQEI